MGGKCKLGISGHIPSRVYLNNIILLLLFPTPICPWARRSFYCYYTKETVPYRPDENLCLPLTAYSF